MTRFENCVAFVLAHEGEYSDDSRDLGGKTCFGVSWKAWPKEADSIIALYQSGKKEEARQQAIALYRNEYWERLKVDRLRLPLDLAMLDAAVNLGPERAVRLLQLECNRQLRASLKLDGVLGPATLRAANALPATLAAIGVCGQRLNAYAKMPRDTRQAHLTGWVRRVADLVLGIAGSAQGS